MEENSRRVKIVDTQGNPWSPVGPIRCWAHHNTIQDMATALPVIIGYKKHTGEYVAMDKAACCSANCVKWFQTQDCASHRSKLLQDRLTWQQEVYRANYNLQFPVRDYKPSAINYQKWDMGGNTFGVDMPHNPFESDLYTAGGTPINQYEELYCTVKHKST